jgi:hypothetical protein
MTAVMGWTMRFVVVLAMSFLASCASDTLVSAPPAGVDFSGHWKLNEADSDDPMHLVQIANTPAAPAAASRQSGRGGAPQGLPGPVTPPVSALGEGLRFPGKLLEIKQSAGAVTFISDGRDLECRPRDEKDQHHRPRSDSDEAGRDSRERDAPPAQCGWEDRTLIVQGGDPDDEHAPFEEHYSLSPDGRLVEIVSFNRGRSRGFTMSRVWDRVP